MMRDISLTSASSNEIIFPIKNIMKMKLKDRIEKDTQIDKINVLKQIKNFEFSRLTLLDFTDSGV